jgi:hypothetical protein
VQFEAGFSRPLISDIEPHVQKGDPFSHPSGSNSGPIVGVQSALWRGSRKTSVPKRVHSVADEPWFQNRAGMPLCGTVQPRCDSRLGRIAQRCSCFSSHENMLWENIPLQSVLVISEFNPFSWLREALPKGVACTTAAAAGLAVRKSRSPS